jgi:hypothetical protein
MLTQTRTVAPGVPEQVALSVDVESTAPPLAKDVVPKSRSLMENEQDCAFA